MKILMVTSSLFEGGAETHIYELSRTLVKKGHAVTVLSAGGRLTPLFEAAGIKTKILPLNKKSPFSVLASMLGIRRILKAGDFDVVHAHARLSAFYLSFFKRRIPLFVTTAHWVFATRGYRRHLTCWGQRTLAVSPDIAEYLAREYRLPEERIRLTLNGIDTQRFHCPKSSAKEIPAVLHVSRLDKGRSGTTALLIECAPALAERYPSLRIFIVGGGSEEKELRQRANEMNERIGRPVLSLCGAVADPLPYLQSASVFVGVSRAALEAMSCSLPVILCGDEGYSSIFTPKEKEAALSNFCCRGAEKATKEALFSDLTVLLDDPQRAHVLGMKNREYVLSEFEAERMAEDALALYASLPHKANGKRILLAGFYGGQNLGDEAILQAACRLFANTRSLTVLSHAPRRTKKQYGLSAVGRFSFLLSLLFGKYDGLVLGGGNLLQDSTSRRSLHYYLLLLKIAKKRKIPFAVWGGIGPLSKKGEKKVKKLLPAADGLYLRTTKDVSEVTALCQTATPKLCPDPAFLLHAKRRRKQNTLILAIKRGSKPPIPAIRELIRRTRLSPVVIAMSKEDLSYARRLAAKLEAPVFVPKTLGLFTDWLASARLVIASRLHAAILALNCATPTLLLRDGGKCDALADDIATLIEPSPVRSTEKDALLKDAEELLSIPKDVPERAHTLLLSRIKEAQP